MTTAYMTMVKIMLLLEVDSSVVVPVVSPVVESVVSSPTGRQATVMALSATTKTRRPKDRKRSRARCFSITPPRSGNRGPPRPPEGGGGGRGVGAAGDPPASRGGGPPPRRPLGPPHRVVAEAPE